VPVARGLGWEGDLCVVAAAAPWYTSFGPFARYSHPWPVLWVPVMKMLLPGTLTLLLFVTPATAQPPWGREYTYARLPEAKALDRVNLTTVWRAHLPIAGRRDGVFTVQFVDRQLLVQTIRGAIVCLDADSGRIKWKTTVGRSYLVSHPLAYNKQFVFA